MSLQKKILLLGTISAVHIFVIGIIFTASDDVEAEPQKPFEVSLLPLDQPLREAPKRFKPGTHVPRKGEGASSGSIDLNTFSPERDLVSVYDDRVWWESEHDTGDDEDDHVMHRAIVRPFKRVIEAVAARGGTLEVHDAYRAKGIHNPRSLHKEGRALDLTCDDFPLEELAKICWQAGFTWVYYERRGGAHIHCSINRDYDEHIVKASSPANAE